MIVCLTSECICVVAAVVALWGGQTKPHAYAQEDAWNKILAFLWKHLYFNSILYSREASSGVISAE
ncbi:MAG: acyl-CoA thioester hydrolase/BAAT C-terminal domain-containing protein [Cetobacterium sp.]